MENVISANNANRLYWLGRYAERGYFLLHLMRRAYDEVIDVPIGEKPYSDFLKKLDVYVSDDFTTSYQMMSQIYDENTLSSLRSVIERMMDNAIVLRSYIYSESFSYIEMCRDLIRRKADSKEMNITELQPITDWLLAFWGSIRERVHGEAYSMLEIGRLTEQLDMFVRFEYKHYRMTESWTMTKRYVTEYPALFDKEQAARIDEMISDEEFHKTCPQEFKTSILGALGCLVRL